MPHIKKIAVALLMGFAGLTSLQAGAETKTAPTITSANAEFVYKYLLGEVALQRGEATLGSQLFLDLAKQTRDARLAERAARAAVFANQPGLALQASTLWAELDPASQEAQQASSQLLIASGNMKEAKPHMQKLLSQEDKRANGFLFLNALLANQKDKAEVLNTISELAAPYPKLPEAHLAVAQAALIANKFDLAKIELETANKLRPGWELAAQMQGQMLLKESPDKAIAYFQGFLKQYPKAGDVRMAYAKTLVSQKRFDEAKPEFVKLVESSKGSPEISAVVGLLSLESSDYPMADKYFQQSISSGFKDPEQLYGYLGRSAERQKEDAKALDWYAKIKPGEHYLEGRLSAAGVLARTKNVDVAIKMLDEVDDLTPDQQILVIQNEANLLSQAKRNQESFEMLNKAASTWPASAEITYDHAMAAERVGKYDIMETQLRKLIKGKPEFAAAYNALGYSFADRNVKLPEAQNLLETAVKLAPDDHYMLDSLGWVHYRLGNLDKAAEFLKKAYAVQADPEIAAHLGEVLWKQGKLEEAKKLWASALKDFPENDVLLATAKKFKS
ncbi:MAG: tetratricopeptide repeat protein [Bdellovibrio sp.]|nr:tetratricopeptide repeat protein [Methylotenera sp.]